MYQYNSKNPSAQSGYIALISVIILGAILVAVAASLSFLTFSQSGAGLDALSKEQSYALAYSCVDHALLKLIQNNSYAGNETYAIGSDQCTIGLVSTGAGGGSSTRIIPTSATSGSSTTSLRITVDATTLQTVSFEEK